MCCWRSPRLSDRAGRSSLRSTNTRAWSTFRLRLECAQHQRSVVEYMVPAREYFALATRVRTALTLCREVLCASDRYVRSTSTQSWSTWRLRQECTQQQHSVIEYIALAALEYIAHCCVVVSKSFV